MDIFRKRTSSSESQQGREVKSSSVEAQELEEQFGLKVLVEGNNPVVEQVIANPHVGKATDNRSVSSIVAVHGLNGHREKTWTADNNILWLQDLLPKKVSQARIITYGYDSRTHSSEHLTRQTLYGHATNFVSRLSLYREETEVFTCYCLKV